MRSIIPAQWASRTERTRTRRNLRGKLACRGRSHRPPAPLLVADRGRVAISRGTRLRLNSGRRFQPGGMFVGRTTTSRRFCTERKGRFRLRRFPGARPFYPGALDRRTVLSRRTLLGGRGATLPFPWWIRIFLRRKARLHRGRATPAWDRRRRNRRLSRRLWTLLCSREGRLSGGALQ